MNKVKYKIVKDCVYSAITGTNVYYDVFIYRGWFLWSLLHSAKSLEDAMGYIDVHCIRTELNDVMYITKDVL